MRATIPAKFGLAVDLTEQIEQRTQHSVRFRHPDGTSYTSVLVSNLNYQVRPGEWESQDYAFRLDQTAQVADRHWFHTRVSDSGIEVSHPETGVGMRWLLPSRPVAAKNTARLSMDGVAWEWAVGPRRLKMSGVVASPRGLRTYGFRYQPLGAGQDFHIQAGAAVSPGIVVAVPYVIGANSVIYPTSGWRMAPGPKLEFIFDDAGLPPEAYPYVLDPTTTLRPGSEGFDNRIDDAEPDTNRATGVAERIGDADPAANRAGRLLIKFDVSSIDPSVTVSNATFSLFEQSAQGVGPGACALHRLLRDWVEAEATWNDWKTSNAWSTAGATNTTSDRSSTVSASLTLDGTGAAAYVDWDGNQLDTDVGNFVSGSVSNFGWVLEAANENQGANADNSLFSMSDNSTEAERPKLVVTHSITAQEQVAAAQVGGVQPVLIPTGMRPY